MTVCIYMCIFALLYIAASILFTILQMNPYIQAVIMIIMLVLDIYLTALFMQKQVLKKWMDQQ